MQTAFIHGQERLHGSIRVSGAKNLALKLLPATLLTDEPVIFDNLPDIEDVRLMLRILEQLGARVTRHDVHRVEICCRDVKTSDIDRVLAEKLRASVLFIGPLLRRFGKVRLPHPGGDVIGKRPINFHLEGFEALGAQVTTGEDFYELTARELVGTRYVFELQSVTATENLLLAAVGARGRTVLTFAACEPEIVALCDFLNSLGARITGAGTHTIVVEGVEKLTGGEWHVMPDRIETGTFALMAAITRSQIRITDCDPTHLEVVWKVLEKVGVQVRREDNAVEVIPGDVLRSYHLRTREYPGFPTDLQAPFTVLMTQAQGHSLIHETIWDGRLFYIDHLNRMGADILMCDPHRVIVHGATKLVGRRVESPDIRAGMAMVMAAMVAEGQSQIDHMHHIDRGYEQIEERLRGLGVRIERKEIAQ